MRSDTHNHMCTACGHVWAHGERERMQMGTKAAHTCPSCKRSESYYKYQGSESRSECARMEALIRAEDHEDPRVAEAASKLFQRYAQALYDRHTQRTKQYSDGDEPEELQ